jgi:signal transduction histidine kinase
MVSGISLANKCQLLFGLAVLVILSAALSVPWLRARTLIREHQLEWARQVADRWMMRRSQPDGAIVDEQTEEDPLRITLVPVESIDLAEDRDPFLARALERFRDDDREIDTLAVTNMNQRTVYRYARALRASQMRTMRNPALADLSAGVAEPGVADPIRALLVIHRASELADTQLTMNRVYIVASGLAGGAMSVLVFYLILTKLILSPVRHLRRTSEAVQRGDLTARSAIRTGDEFEQLSGAFNAMLDQIQQGQARLQALNTSLDLKLNELSEANIGLYESNRLKSQFLANISHELRTPLNSIIGFAELLLEIARSEPDADPKRQRYISNILASGRSLLDMINELLEMAKIEAGRIELSIAPTNVSDLVEGLLNIMRPQAQRKNLDVQSRLAPGLPVVETDPGKLQQILYNFMSNAIKFTPEGGSIVVSVDQLEDPDSGVRVAVADTGPGIAPDMQEMAFEKFRQLDASHTREHAGTGLGLAICKELAELLGASVGLESRPGHGATFFVDLPLTHRPRAPQPLMG